ncbi:DUF3347 domain-containing protein [Segetibacter aerophilus]|uniref:DUF3347 domain-containing protein n=1 Tax=Segetibacter aerophilus TaxID=670293 RepID=UPI001FE4714D|nr:DUF3347 domain-containing protein [Segetibacter aerophilus]
MKKLILIATILGYTSIAAITQNDHAGHEQKSTTSNKENTTKATVVDANTQQQFSRLLSSYLNIKNALVAGDATSAASNANQFLRTANTVDYKVISEGNVHILSNDAGKISATKDLKKQREIFASLSSNMASVAKAFKLSDKPLYLQYCPMKKASWLSLEKQIKNPYYGTTMLTCGEVQETL